MNKFSKLTKRVAGKVLYLRVKVHHNFEKYIYVNSQKLAVSAERRYHEELSLLLGSGCKLASYNELIRYKQSDTLFILGSGTSINDITPAQWEHVAANDSIGFNLFMLHDFIPTFYHMEYSPHVFDLIKECYQSKPKEFKEKPFLTFFRHVDKNRPFSDYDFPKRNFYTLPRYVYTNQNEKALTKVLNQNYFESDFKQNNYYIHHRASVSLLMSLGVMLGYRSIVLLGIDLNHSNYFFEVDLYNDNHIASHFQKYISDHRSKSNQQRIAGKFHATASKHLYPQSFTIDKFIQIYHQNVLQKLGIQLYIGSKNSLLYPMLKAYKFED